ncbi:MAG TPA: hypothetical protein PKD84_01165 [Propionicimonas sp.]|nr:hypothetical protein [Propionicimonas sp.]
MMTVMIEALSRTQIGLERLGRRAAVEALQPGLSSGETGGIFPAAGLRGDEQVEAVHFWHDGTRTAGLTLDDIQIFPGFHLLSLEDAMANYRAFVADPR